MPRLDSSDDGSGSGNLLLWVVAALVVCGLGYGAYWYMQPSEPRLTAEEIKKAAIREAQFRARVDKRLEEAKSEEQKSREALGLTTTQTAALEALDKIATSSEGRRDLMRNILTPEQRDLMRRQGGRGGFGGRRGGPGGGFGGGFGGPGGGPPGGPPPDGR
jgi:hypothetical protein